MSVEVTGQLGPGVMAKDVILAIINEIGVDGGVGYVIEYRGEVIRSLSMEGRMTVCNMSIEGGARAGLIAPDETTFEYVKGRPRAPQGEAWEQAVEYWRTLPTDEGARFDCEVVLDGAAIEPFVTWGTNPGQSVRIGDVVPDPSSFAEPSRREAATRALEYMDLEAGTPIREIAIDRVFLGSCTNARIDDLRAAASIVEGKQVASSVHAMVVPGSGLVKAQAEEEGLDAIFTAAGFEWRDAGCSMCLGMNPDILLPGERCASTSNRNFEGRQGPGGTHAPGESADGGGGGDRRPLRRCEGAGLMDPVSRVVGKAIPLNRANVDTDQIIPAKYLKRIERTGYGPFAFEAWRADPDFVLNNPAYEGAPILIAQQNLGSGSSREHAVWAIQGLGVSALIAPSFADIFKNNCFQGGVLTVELAQEDVDWLMARAEETPDAEIEVDLETQTVRAGPGWERSFEIDAFRKYRLLRGLDDIGMTLEYEADVERFEQSRSPLLPTVGAD